MLLQHEVEAHFTYQTHRHWCPTSEKFASGDALLSLMDAGWRPEQIVFLPEYSLSSGRYARVYQFHLFDDQHMIEMCVVQNPFVERIIAKMGLSVNCP
jgi:hypothetical protein